MGLDAGDTGDERMSISCSIKSNTREYNLTIVDLEDLKLVESIIEIIKKDLGTATTQKVNEK